MTIQNEPLFWTNTYWEACSYSSQTSSEFLKNYLGPQIQADFPDEASRPKILI